MVPSLASHHLTTASGLPASRLLPGAKAGPPPEGGGIWFCFAWENSSVYRYLDCEASLPALPHLGLKTKPSSKGPELGLQAGKGAASV